ncbi:hypothetical protein BKA82DRAFT_4098232 [Pisolithus tinctorius]|nr:hypothetical protein BKA82DRAFT_4098232 [Pisolithus tinctorius]
MGILLGIQFGKPIVDPFNPPKTSVITVVVIFVLFPPILCDSILLTRIFALYPISSTPPATLLKIFTIPFCVKCARVVVIILFVDDCSRGIAIVPDRLFRNPNLIAEWTMQTMDNMYSVGLFLYNLHVRTGSIKRSGGMPARVR